MTMEKDHQPNIMVVDDTPANLKLLEGMLQQRGCQVRSFLRGRLALDAAATEPPDLILLDVNMTEMNGYEVCKELKADAKLKDIPVLFISALNETSDKVKAFDCGGVDYVTKPFQFKEVYARVETHLELRRQKRELQENYARLRELETLRDNLTHMIIHDMRSPLSGMLGYLDLVRMKISAKLGPVESEYFNLVQRSAEKMVRMTTAVLDVSQLESGQMPLNRQAYDLTVLARTAVESLGSLVGQRRLSMEASPEPVMAKADKEIIERVITNLLSNALKFTPDFGDVRITASRKDAMARLAVTDTGPGIPAEHHAKIFEKFGALDKGAHGYSTGLGLAFCKLAVEAHGGKMGVESEVGKGSAFWFELPVA